MSRCEQILSSFSSTFLYCCCFAAQSQVLVWPRVYILMSGSQSIMIQIDLLVFFFMNFVYSLCGCAAC